MKYHRRRGRLRWYFIGRAIRETDVRGEDKCPVTRRGDPAACPGIFPSVSSVSAMPLLGSIGVPCRATNGKVMWPRGNSQSVTAAATRRRQA